MKIEECTVIDHIDVLESPVYGADILLSSVLC